MGQRPKEPDVLTIEHSDQLAEFCQRCREAGQFAFDTEFVMEDRFEPELCLVQIATDSCAATVDPFLNLDLQPVWDLVCDEHVATVVHAGQEDLSLCVQETGRGPRNVYDVQIAAGFAGYDYPLSLQKLVQLTRHVRLHKSKTLTDWRRRPLTPAQLRYAAEDVCHLLAIRHRLDERLRQWNRLDWAQEEFSRFEDLSSYRRAEEEKLVRIKGAGALWGRPLVVLRAVLAWREETAQRLNRPIRAVLKDHLLVEIAKHELCSPKEIRDLRGLNLSDRHVRALGRVVREALNTPRDQWPPPPLRDSETPAETALVTLVTAVIRSYCVEHTIAYGLVASKKSTQRLVRHCLGLNHDDDIDLLSGWRGRTVGAVAREILGGQRVVRVERHDGTWAIRTARQDHTPDKTDATPS